MAFEASSLPNASLEKRIHIEQIDALFSAVTAAVLSAALGAFVLVAILDYFGFINARVGIVWASSIAVCALGHSLLCIAYNRSRPVGMHSRKWAFWFTVLAFAEGLGWGWAPIGLSTSSRFDVEALIVLVVMGIAAGAMQAFGPYLPAFLVLFLPATSSYIVANITSPDPFLRISCILMLIFMGAVVNLAVKGNRTFRQHIALRIRSEELAADLQQQKDIAEQQKDIAERANLAKSTFLAAASHDLRQPVHALGLFVGALRNIAMPPEAQRLLEQIEASSSAMDSLFAALLDISRLDAGIVEVHRRPFAIGPLLERICADHAEEAEAEGTLLVSKRSSFIVMSDPVLMERILRNLVSNAVRYTEQGRVIVGCRRRGTQVAVQVWDTGCGIPLDQQERVFQEYYQLGNSERDRAKGLGLGLAIVRRLTDLLECKLTLRSRPGRGSCFEVMMDLAVDYLDTVNEDVVMSSGAFAHGLIVVIDDEMPIREAMKSLLTGWGHDVITASSGDDAVHRLSTCTVQPDLIICDYRLRDGENGIEVIERLRSEYNEAIPAMLVTGDTAPDRLIEAQESGLLLLHKPVSNGKLRAAMINLIAVDKSDRTDASDADRMEDAELSSVR